MPAPFAEARAVPAIDAPPAPPRPLRGHTPDWADTAARRLRRLGFLLDDASAAELQPACLLIALRATPSGTHFDPERVTYYEATHDGAAPVDLDRRMVVDGAERSVLWGQLHVVDRVPVENRFLTFGGRLRAAVIDDELTVIELRSPGPIVRWGGHSQGTDKLAEEIGAFFGRLMVRVDDQPGAAGRLAAAPPAVLFAAFLADAGRRSAAAVRRVGRSTDLDRWLRRTARYARADADTWARGERLLGELGLRAARVE